MLWIESAWHARPHLARLEFVGDGLVAEVNSEKRLGRVRQLLTAIAGVHELTVTPRIDGSSQGAPILGDQRAPPRIHASSASTCSASSGAPLAPLRR